MRILIARESALCQPLCSLTFEMAGRGRGERGKIKTQAWGGPLSLGPLPQEAGFCPSFGKGTERSSLAPGPHRGPHP